jgi:lipoyl-dependent peroxiredoxin
MATRTAEATWNGDLPNGNGTMRFGGGAYQGAYSAKSRFEEGDGTNPEELIAAAEAGCFSMAFANELAKAGYEPKTVETTAAVRLRMLDDKPTIDRIELTTRAQVPGIEEGEFQRIAEEVKTGCIVSRALAAVETFEIDATLEA